VSKFDSVFGNGVSLTLKKEEALVLFAMLVDVKQESAIPIGNAAERQAIWNLVAHFESILVEPFMTDYPDIIEEAKRRLL